MKEQLRKELLIAATNILGEESAKKLETAFTFVLFKYKIEEETTNIIPYDDSNVTILRNYTASLRLEGMSEQTIDQYERSVRNFLNYLGKPYNKILTNDVRYYLARYLTDRKVSKTTLDNLRRNLSAFFSWLTAEEYITKNPMLRIKKIKSDKKIRKGFNVIELEKIRQSVTDPKEKALVEFLLSTGCRVSEAGNLHLQNIDFRTGEAIVYGKGAKERVVYIGDKALYYLNLYLTNRKNNSTFLFTNRDNNKMTKQNIEVLLNKIGERAEVNNVHPHRFRRTFATDAAKRGMPIQYIQKLLGHADIKTTMEYCDIDMDYIKAEYKRVA